MVVGAFFIHPANLRWDALPPAADVAVTVGTLIFAFTGIETALMPSGEVKDPTRTVPRAAMLALAVATLLYLGVQAVGLGVMGTGLANDTVAPLATTNRDVRRRHRRGAGARGRLGVDVRLAHRFDPGRPALFALARATGSCRAGLPPMHPRWHTPWIAIAVYGVIDWSRSR